MRKLPSDVATRINLLDELKGNFSTVIIGTFTADLAFFEKIFAIEITVE